jgi:hypothetical protein
LQSEWVTALSNLNQLRVLDVSFTAVDSRLMAQSLQSKRLVELTLTDTKVDDQVVETLTSAIQFLDLTATNITDRSLIYLSSHCHYLKRLDLQNCRRLSMEAIVSCCSQLKYLSKLDVSLLPFKEQTATLTTTLIDLCSSLQILCISPSPDGNKPEELTNNRVKIVMATPKTYIPKSNQPLTMEELPLMAREGVMPNRRQ